MHRRVVRSRRGARSRPSAGPGGAAEPSSPTASVRSSGLSASAVGGRRRGHARTARAGCRVAHDRLAVLGTTSRRPSAVSIACAQQVKFGARGGRSRSAPARRAGGPCGRRSGGTAGPSGRRSATASSVRPSGEYRSDVHLPVARDARAGDDGARARVEHRDPLIDRGPARPPAAAVRAEGQRVDADGIRARGGVGDRLDAWPAGAACRVSRAGRCRRCRRRRACARRG